MDEGRDRDMLDYRYFYAVTVTEDRIRSLRRERNLQRQFKEVRRQPDPRAEGRRRWSVADVVSLLVPSRGAR